MPTQYINVIPHRLRELRQAIGRYVERFSYLARYLYWRGRLGQRLRCHGFVFFHPRLLLWPHSGGFVEFGRNANVRHDVDIESTGAVRIGARTYIGHGMTLACMESVTIGDDCLIAEYVTIRDNDHSFDATDRLITEQGATIAPVCIGSNVWIGAKATVVAGVSIGSGSVIGANAVVTRDIPEGVVAVGIPARVIRKRSEGTL